MLLFLFSGDSFSCHNFPSHIKIMIQNKNKNPWYLTPILTFNIPFVIHTLHNIKVRCNFELFISEKRCFLSLVSEAKGHFICISPLVVLNFFMISLLFHLLTFLHFLVFHSKIQILQINRLHIENEQLFSFIWPTTNSQY